MATIAKRRGRYILDFYDNEGKRRWQTLPAGTTLTRAREAMRDIEDQLAKGVYLPDRRTPAFAEVAREWIEHKRLNLRASTWSVYEGHVRNHFAELNGLKVNRITTAVIEKWIRARQTDGMHLVTLRKVLVSLHQIMAYAVRHRYLDHNPVRDSERPRGQGQEKEKRIRVLTPDEIQALLDATPVHKYRTLFMVAIMTGARQGELLGLKWSDVDWDNSQIRIGRTFNNGAWYEPKTSTSTRRVDIGPATLTELKRWKLACPSNPLDLIFPNDNGQPMNHSNLVKRHFEPALANAAIVAIRFHDLRHTFASLLIEQGENIKYIQTQLGHSSPTVTLNVYAHLMKPSNPESARRLENTVFAPTGSKMVAGC